MSAHPIPAEETRSELRVANSRFIAALAPAFSVDGARQFIARIRAEFPDASHHVPAYRIGFGASVITHCSDDGEPSGSAGRPALAVLNGSGLGDAAVVVTRYFGGTKLGVGGLVRAYGDSVRQVLQQTRRAAKIPVQRFRICAPYPWYERIQRMIQAADGQVVEQEFSGEVALRAKIPLAGYPDFCAALTEASHGALTTAPIDIVEEIIPIERIKVP